jgi:homoserine O-acetyltransferase
MRRSVAPGALAILLAFAGEAAAQAPAATEHDYVLKDFRFGTGETLPELKIHYRTWGAPRRNARGVVENAVLVLHGTSGSGRQFVNANFAGVLFGPGQLLDAARWFVVIPDGIGHGGSSKPSDGLHARFPRYDYDDMVAAQHRLLTEGLRVDHLRLVMGTSMGGMHAWAWAEKYPDFMDGLVPLAALPGPISGRNRAWRKIVIDAIRDDPEWKGGDYSAPPRGLVVAARMLALMSGSPRTWQKAAPTLAAADSFLDEQTRSRLAGVDANDLLYAFEASRDYDPSTGFDRIRRPILAINFADDLINPPELQILERAVARIPSARAIVVPASDDTRGHGTHTLAAIWQEHLRAFLAALPAE